MDAYDRKILAALQRDGRISNLELADSIGLSPTPCARRVKALEEARVIRDYVARLSPESLEQWRPTTKQTNYTVRLLKI